MTTRSPQLIPGAYADLNALLALRFRPAQPLTMPSRVFGQQSGLRLSRFKGRGVDFAEVRPYQPGDDIRSIDWRVTARKNKPHTKVFREERERPTLILVDQSQSMFFGSRTRLKSVAAAEVAATAAWQSLTNNDRVGGLVIRNTEVRAHKPFRSIKSVARFLGDVADSNQALNRTTHLGSPMVIEDALLRLRRLTRNNYRIILISDFCQCIAQWQDAIHKLAPHNQIAVVHIYDALERTLPPADLYSVTDGKNRLQFDAGNRALRAKYEAEFADRIQSIEQMCAHESIRFTSVATDEPYTHRTLW